LWNTNDRAYQFSQTFSYLLENKLLQNTLSFLFFDNSKREKIIETTDDLELSKILDNETIAVLRQQCTVEEAKARQDIFRELSQPEILLFFEQLHQEIIEADRLNRCYTAASSILEKRISCFFYCKKILEIRNLLVGCRSNSSFICQVRDKILNKDMLYTKMQDALDKYNEIIRRISSFTISDVNGTIKTAVNEEPITIIQKITDCMEEMGFPIQHSKGKQHLKLGAQTVNILTHHFSTEIESLACLDSYRDIWDMQELAILKQDIEFYLSINELVNKATQHGLPHCFPEYSDTPLFTSSEAYDITLLPSCNNEIVPNDINFTKVSKQFFLIGKNGGGKTTYLRTVAVNLIFALAGAPVFARNASVFPFRHLVTYFPISAETGISEGRLGEEMTRFNQQSKAFGKYSFIFLNEAFSSTSDEKGTSIALDSAELIRQKHSFMLFVTHFVNITDSNFSVLVTAEEEPYRIRSFDRMRTVFAEPILQKYGLTKELLGRRIGRIL